MAVVVVVSYDGDCLDGPEGCEGETFPRLALSGSGDSYSRCDRHDALYVERVQPKIDEINRRYPAMAPADFDPTFCGEAGLMTTTNRGIAWAAGLYEGEGSLCMSSRGYPKISLGMTDREPVEWFKETLGFGYITRLLTPAARTCTATRLRGGTEWSRCARGSVRICRHAVSRASRKCSLCAPFYRLHRIVRTRVRPHIVAT